MKKDSLAIDMETFYNKCRNTELSVTPERLAVYKALSDDESHPSPEKIYKTIKTDFPTISFATIYRTLEAFKEAVIISKVTALHKKNPAL